MGKSRRMRRRVEVEIVLYWSSSRLIFCSLVILSIIATLVLAMVCLPFLLRCIFGSTGRDPSLGRRVSNSMAMSLLQQLVIGPVLGGLNLPPPRRTQLIYQDPEDRALSESIASFVSILPRPEIWSELADRGLGEVMRQMTRNRGTRFSPNPSDPAFNQPTIRYFRERPPQPRAGLIFTTSESRSRSSLSLEMP